MKKLMFVVAALLLLPVAAQAGTVTFSSIGTSYSVSGYWTNASGVSKSLSTTAGAQSLVFSGFAGDEAWVNGQTMTGYCVDLTTLLSSPVTASLESMSDWYTSGPKGSVSPITAGARASFLYNSYSNPTLNSYQRAGLQLAIWNALYDTDFVVDAGTGFKLTTVDSTVKSWANNYLLGLQSATTFGDYGTWVKAVSAQDFIVGPPPTPEVPEPGSMLLLGTGLLGAAGAVRRRLTRKN